MFAWRTMDYTLLYRQCCIYTLADEIHELKPLLSTFPGNGIQCTFTLSSKFPFLGLSHKHG